MAEDVRNIKEILEELFKEKTILKRDGTRKKEKSALDKYAMVRRTQYEINDLWFKCGLPLNEIPKRYRDYFSSSFLGGCPIQKARNAELIEALNRLDHAVADGCRKRCTNLVNELNCALEQQNLPAIRDVEGFLNWLTFDYCVKKDCNGEPVIEKPYGFEIRIFKSDQNRKEFWFLIQRQLSNKKAIKLQETAWWVKHYLEDSITLRD